MNTVCSFPGCPEIAPRGVARCEEHRPKPWSGGPSKHHLNRPKGWEAMRRKVLARDHFRCKVCRRRGGHVDHIVRVADGGSWEMENLQVLCAEHHAEKTRAEMRQPRRSK